MQTKQNDLLKHIVFNEMTGEFEGIVHTTKTDLEGDIFEPFAFQEQIENKNINNIIFLYNHNKNKKIDATLNDLYYINNGNDLFIKGKINNKNDIFLIKKNKAEYFSPGFECSQGGKKKHNIGCYSGYKIERSPLNIIKEISFTPSPVGMNTQVKIKSIKNNEKTNFAQQFKMFAIYNHLTNNMINESNKKIKNYLKEQGFHSKEANDITYFINQKKNEKKNLTNKNNDDNNQISESISDSQSVSRADDNTSIVSNISQSSMDKSQQSEVDDLNEIVKIINKKF